ncbi:D-alanyl-D-alanine carboxypeptidase/D-alanyl-D-alanine-endopeptidase [Sinomonas flava]|uniref:D-alanyl-D-alanine carboxypeptidase/D-alanyl-D-alanine endopeptidase n=1 Tax=Sinomonas flava TaxID=496857 RepID=UPI0039A77D75
MSTQRGPRAPLTGLWAPLAAAVALAVALAVVLVATGLATDARSALFPAPTPTATTPGWLAPPSSAPALAGAAPLSTAAPLPEADRLARDLAPRLALGTGSIGGTVLDASTGRVLFSQAGGDARVPASNLKLLTAAAVLTSLGPDARLRTRAVRPDAGTVVLAGGGDAMLAAGSSQPDAVMGRAGLATLAADTAKALAPAAGAAHDAATSPQPAPSPPRTVTVRLDDTLFTGPALSPAWDPADVAAGEIAPVYALALNGARTAPGAPGPRPQDTALDAANAFRDALAAALAGTGVTVAAGVSRVAAPVEGQELAAVESAPLGEQVDYMLRESDNYLAEVLARLAAHAQGGPAANEGAVAALRAAAVQVLGTADGLEIADACGLSLGNRISPTALATLVREMAVGSDERLRAALGGFPVAALDGTLGSRFAGSAAAGAGVVRAKTGTLNTVAALSGYAVDADGRLLVFSFVANGLDPGRRGEAVQALDGAAAALAACGCR